jgi:hypothetical protein
VFFNELRTGSFDALLASAGTELTPEQLKAVGHFVNASTGYGSLGRLEAVSPVLNEVLYSPRNLAANIQYGIAQPLWNKNARGVRMMIAKQYGKQMIGLAVAYALAKLAGADISMDVRSADFGKWKFGNTRLDPLMGLSQTVVAAGRAITGQVKSADGTIRPAKGTDSLKRFMQNKLSPNYSLIADLMDRQTSVGEALTFRNEIEKAGPITYMDIANAMQEQGVPAGSAMGIAAFFGLGLQTYQTKQHPGSPRNRAPRERRPKR